MLGRMWRAVRSLPWVAIVVAALGASGGGLIGSAVINVEVNVTPESDRDGWRPEALEELEIDAPRLAIVDPDSGLPIAQDNARRDVRLWKAAVTLLDGEHLPNYPQQTGDCVSFSVKNAVDHLSLNQIARDPFRPWEFRTVFPPYIYGTSRVQVGLGKLRGEGSLVAWAAKAVRDYGVLATDAENCPEYSGRIAKTWGRRGPPEEFLEVGKRTPVRGIARVETAGDVRDALCNGYPVAIGSRFGTKNRSIRERDGRMVARRDGSWSHALCVLAYDGSVDPPLFYILNSWGPSAHPEPLQDEPPGGFWITWDDMDRMARDGDGWTFSDFAGFPARDMDFHVLADPAALAEARQHVHVEECATVMTRPVSEVYMGTDPQTALMVGLGLVLLALACLVPGMARWVRPRRMQSGLLLLLVALGGSLQADEFRVLAPPKATPTFAPIAVEECPNPACRNCRCADDVREAHGELLEQLATLEQAVEDLDVELVQLRAEVARLRTAKREAEAEANRGKPIPAVYNGRRVQFDSTGRPYTLEPIRNCRGKSCSIVRVYLPGH
ncbi:MAG: hypothetical protein AAFZ07_20115 [Actinomycetota bacterium]